MVSPGKLMGLTIVEVVVLMQMAKQKPIYVFKELA